MKLNDLMEFDHVVRVHEDGTVTDADGVYAPDVFNDGEDVDDGWELLRGYTGQYMYHGPVMHPSEFIGGGLERDILAEPGLYVALVVYAGPDGAHEMVTSSLGSQVYCKVCGHGGCEDNSDEAVGWVVARKVEA